jgi:hypothetical protein
MQRGLESIDYSRSGYVEEWRIDKEELRADSSSSLKAAEARVRALLVVVMCTV